MNIVNKLYKSIKFIKSCHLLIKNANVIDANGNFQGDILILDGIINQIGKK